MKLFDSLRHCRWILALAVLPLVAADVAGTWTGLAVTDDGKQGSLYFRLQVAGAQITGTIGPRADEQYPISEGKLEGNKVTLAMTLPGKGVYRFDLTLDGDTLRGDGRLSGPEGEFHGKAELKRAP